MHTAVCAIVEAYGSSDGAVNSVDDVDHVIWRCEGILSVKRLRGCTCKRGNNKKQRDEAFRHHFEADRDCSGVDTNRFGDVDNRHFCFRFRRNKQENMYELSTEFAQVFLWTVFLSRHKRDFVNLNNSNPAIDHDGVSSKDVVNVSAHHILRRQRQIYSKPWLSQLLDK